MTKPTSKYVSVRPPRFGRTCAIALAAAALLIFCAAPNAGAASKIWDGGGTNANWATAANWNGNSLPADGDNVTFRFFISGTSINLGADRTVGQVTIRSTAPFSLNGNTLILNSGNLTRVNVAGTENDQVINSAVQLKGDGVWTINGSGTLTVSGNISEGGVTSQSLTKAGTTTLILSGNNTYTGGTEINAGVLRVDSAGGLAPGNLRLNGGVLGLGNGDFTRSLGVGAGNFRFSGSGGFAAYNADRTVNIGGAAEPVILEWSITSDFLLDNHTLFLSADDSDHTVTWANPVSLNGTERTLQVADGAADVDAVMSGVLSGGPGSGFHKTGAGKVRLDAANTYGGGTTLSQGTIQLGVNDALPSGAFLDFAGGILEANNRSFSIGALSLSANSTINLSPGGGMSSLTFASTAITPNGTLFINGWSGTGGPGGAGTDDRIFITANPGALLTHVQFEGFAPGAFWDSTTHELLPVPEPVNVALTAFGFIAGGAGLWRRFSRRSS